MGGIILPYSFPPAPARASKPHLSQNRQFLGFSLHSPIKPPILHATLEIRLEIDLHHVQHLGNGFVENVVPIMGGGKEDEETFLSIL